MKFTLRDLFWLILLAAVICLAYRHELSFKRAVELEAIKNKIQYNSQVSSELELKYSANLREQERRLSQHWREMMKEQRETEKAEGELVQKLQEWREDPYRAVEPSEIPPQLRLPSVQPLHMPPVQPKDGA